MHGQIVKEQTFELRNIRFSALRIIVEVDGHSSELSYRVKHFLKLISLDFHPAAGLLTPYKKPLSVSVWRHYRGSFMIGKGKHKKNHQTVEQSPSLTIFTYFTDNNLSISSPAARIR
ncbi:hypothetical protein L4D76_27270 [Photobacterium sagamiensis]|uniref:hypothetical protein n=1 Tax=Photobacterium sagamiensis TaxID=2910241 RepID=UPI003D13AE2A